MRVALVVLLGLGLGIAVPGASCAQSASSSDPFAVPSGPIACHERAVTAKDSAAFVFEMLDVASAQHPRQLMFAFDSAGTPRYGTVMSADLADDAHQAMEVIALRLGEHVAGGRVRAVNGEVDMTGVARDSVPGLPHGASLLNPDELARGATLARWVWARRCAAHRATPPSPSTASPAPAHP